MQVINNLCYLLSGKDFNSQKGYEKLFIISPTLGHTKTRTTMTYTAPYVCKVYRSTRVNEGRTSLTFPADYD